MKSCLATPTTLKPTMCYNVMFLQNELNVRQVFSETLQLVFQYANCYFICESKFIPLNIFNSAERSDRSCLRFSKFLRKMYNFEESLKKALSGWVLTFF